MRIAFLSWRDFTHPEGGGAERYVETIAAHLVGRGHEVTIYCAAHGDALAHEVKNGVTYLRQGGRLTVYPSAVRALRRHERRNGPYDVVVDSQNGIPFFSPWGTRSPVLVLLHHVHREQWPVIFGPIAAKIGWLIESRVASACTAAGSTSRSLAGPRRSSSAGCRYGPSRGHPQRHGRSHSPWVSNAPQTRLWSCWAGWFRTSASSMPSTCLPELRPRFPRLQLRVIGHGWWHDQIAAHAEASGVTDGVALLGFVDEQTKHAELAASWVALAPSVKEGWGLCVVEAASHGVPTVAYRDAGGLSESIVHGLTGALVEDLDEMASEVSRLLADRALRDEMGAHARDYADQFTWHSTVSYWEDLLDHVARRRAPVAMTDARSQRV